MKQLSLISAVVLLIIPVIAFGQEGFLEYTPMVVLPGMDGESIGSLSGLVNTLYALSISVAGLLAVIKIIIAGLKWMLSDVVTTKSEAKKDMQNALLGLIIVISAVLIITVINPSIVGGA